MKKEQTTGILFALLAAALYALNAPCSKLLLGELGPRMTAAFLYLGAGVGMAALAGIRRAFGKRSTEQRLTRTDLPYTVGMVVLDIAAPILLMLGLTMTTAANASLLNNFEIVATSVIALMIFREPVSGRLWLAIGLVTAASVLLSFEGAGSFRFSEGSLLVLAACVCWGLENNCTRKLSGKDPLEIVIVKGLFSGGGALAIAFWAGERMGALASVLLTMLLGFVAYGLSIFFYIYAQRYLGAARTSTFYAVAPFIGTGISMCVFGLTPDWMFFTALALMAAGAYFAATESRKARAARSAG